MATASRHPGKIRSAPMTGKLRMRRISGSGIARRERIRRRLPTRPGNGFRMPPGFRADSETLGRTRDSHWRRCERHNSLFRLLISDPRHAAVLLLVCTTTFRRRPRKPARPRALARADRGRVRGRRRKRTRLSPPGSAAARLACFEFKL